MGDYNYRIATEKDIPFLARTIIEAEKGSSNQLGLSTLFNLSEQTVFDLLITILEEEIDGCGFSVSSFFVATFNNETVAAYGGWIEQLNGTKPSKILKSNLISFTFPPESLVFFKEKAHLAKELSIERTPLSLQMEYMFVVKGHRGKGIVDNLTKKIEEHALNSYPELSKIEVHVFKDNSQSAVALKRQGFSVVKKCKSSFPEITNFLPSDEKYLMKKNIKK